MNMTKEQFISQMTDMLKETYTTLTREVIEQAYERAIKKEKPIGIMDIFVRDNLQKVDITEK